LRKGVVAAVILTLAAPALAQEKKPPYWASIASGEAMMRTGPGRNYPGVWLYKRRDLPIRVVKTYPNWRLVEDPEGAQGWMLVSLLSDRRTAIVKQGDPRPISTPKPMQAAGFGTTRKRASSAASSIAETGGATSRSASAKAISASPTSGA